MTPDHAAWVREHAWTPAMRAQLQAAPYLTSCPCSMCGYCSTGRHDQCYLVRHPDEHLTRYIAHGVPVTWIYGTNGKTAGPVVDVYEVGHGHGAWCTCHRDGHPGWERNLDLLDHLAAAR